MGLLLDIVRLSLSLLALRAMKKNKIIRDRESGHPREKPDETITERINRPECFSGACPAFRCNHCPSRIFPAIKQRNTNKQASSRLTIVFSFAGARFFSCR